MTLDREETLNNIFVARSANADENQLQGIVDSILESDIIDQEVNPISDLKGIL